MRLKDLNYIQSHFANNMRFYIDNPWGKIAKYDAAGNGKESESEATPSRMSVPKKARYLQFMILIRIIR